MHALIGKGDLLHVHYTGYLKSNGKLFDSTREKSEPCGTQFASSLPLLAVTESEKLGTDMISFMVFLFYSLTNLT